MLSQTIKPIHEPKPKKYDQWFTLKPKINSKTKFATFKKRDVFWCHLGENIVSEEDGKGEFYSRPVTIIKVFNNQFYLVVPLTTKIKENKYYVQFEFLGKPQSAMISQIRSVDARRLKSKLGTISNQDYDKITNELSKFW
jgi:mRNA interferase MazF